MHSTMQSQHRFIIFFQTGYVIARKSPTFDCLSTLCDALLGDGSTQVDNTIITHGEKVTYFIRPQARQFCTRRPLEQWKGRLTIERTTRQKARRPVGMHMFIKISTHTSFFALRKLFTVLRKCQKSSWTTVLCARKCEILKDIQFEPYQNQ